MSLKTTEDKRGGVVVVSETKIAETNETRNSISDIWGPRTPYRGEWPIRVDERTIETPDRWVQSTCLLCSNDCGMDVGVRNGRIVGVRGRMMDRVNKGRLGPKGMHGWVANNSADRLTDPMVRHRGKLRKATWDEAMSLIVEMTKEIKNKFTAGAIGFYNSGQLFIEEYYTLAVIARAGLGTPHVDGNTRLCTATAADSLMQTFGSDGQPGSYADIDTTDCLLLVGHNMASQQTVLWARVLDRLAGPNPPRIVVIDPRTTDTARVATVHLPLKVGTNVAVLNGLINLLIKGNYVDREYIQAHTVGFETLKATVSLWTPEKVEEVSGVPARKLVEAAGVLGRASTLMSTVLQGVYQSNQATAAACQVNNINLIRGMIGKAGCGILQMNGQPTSQNTRETGCDGSMPAFRNWNNPRHMEDLARVWNVEPAIIPHWSAPTHAMQMFRYAEEGSIKMLWITCTNPCVSLPELNRIRRILSSNKVFVIVQDAFNTETTELADVILPAAIWAEKTGTYTNTDRTVHLSYKAIEPPGEAKSDLDIFLDYAGRMDFRDKNGAPLIKWDDPEGAFEAWKKCSKGHLCDYSGITYAKLTDSGGIQWPCNEDAPNGTERLYADGVFSTTVDAAEQYGHDLMTGAALTPDEYEAVGAKGRAMLKPAEYEPMAEQPDANYPLVVTTGRVVYHWHTRTKTGRSEELCAAAPDAFVQVSNEDAATLRIQEGDWVEVATRRGKLQAPAKLGDIIPGHLFVPFHFGYWDAPNRRRAANELTLSGWDPASKQPYFKFAAARLRKIGKPGLKRPRAQKMPGAREKATQSVEPSTGKMKVPRSAQSPVLHPHLGAYLAMIRDGEKALTDGLMAVAKNHSLEPDMAHHCKTFSRWSSINLEIIEPFLETYSPGKELAARAVKSGLFRHGSQSELALLRNLQDLLTLTNANKVNWSIVFHAAEALRDSELEDTCRAALSFVEDEVLWLLTRINGATAQALAVPL